jgi:hypothetical protein
MAKDEKNRLKSKIVEIEKNAGVPPQSEGVKEPTWKTPKNVLQAWTKEDLQDANNFIKSLDDTGLDILKQQFGAVFNDPTMTTEKGTLRMNVTKMNISQLETMRGIATTILEQIDEILTAQKNLDKLFNERLGVTNANERKAVLNIMDYVKNKVGEKVLDSRQIRDIALARFRSSQSPAEIRAIFRRAVKNANGDYDKFIAEFSENGTYI